MKRWITFLLLTICFTAPTVVQAVEKQASLKEVVATLEKGYSNLQDMRASFTQLTTIATAGRNQKGAGEVFIKRPASKTAMFRFDYSKPKQQIVSDGKQVWFYIPENKQVMISSVADMFKGGNAIALSYLTGLGHLERDFSTAFAKEPRDSKGNYQLLLTPKQKNAVLSKLVLIIPAEAVAQYLKSGNVQAVFPLLASIVYDAAENQTRIDYSNIKVNTGISNDKFTFAIPKNVEVIKR